MTQKELILARAEHLAETIMGGRYPGPRFQLSASFVSTGKNIVPLEAAGGLNFKPVGLGYKWGKLWDRGWLKLEGIVPEDWQGSEVVALIDTESEGTVFLDRKVVCGITNYNSRTLFHRKRRIPLLSDCSGGEKIELLVELSANEIFGSWGRKEFFLGQCECSRFRKTWWRLALDIYFLSDLARTLEPVSPRCKKILRGLDQMSALWNNGKNYESCRDITQTLIKSPANASSLTAWSVGHGHLDLAWLWPIEESRRKAVRTFSTALQLMKEYPSYVFGASQPQLYQWVKEDQPDLYERIKVAVRHGTWECQGAMWVEADMNLTGGESLVRQCLYGIKFFQDEFGKRIKNLWLPDVFGYPASLPQILKKCGVEYFTTMKISWNDTNSFPYHTFFWEGIDGSRVLSHFLPAGDYHLNNSPGYLIHAEESYQEAGVTDCFLNMYGIGDGGGGPSRGHIEYLLRAEDCEGVPKTKPSSASAFFQHLSRQVEEQGAKNFSVWRGELYLELHRGTYTSQGRIKKLNRRCEHVLQEAELLSVLNGGGESEQFEKWWKMVLLYQFHDILPGSSIREVNEDAEKKLGDLLANLESYCNEKLLQLAGAPKGDGALLLMNSLCFSRSVLLKMPSGRLRLSCIPPFSAKLINDISTTPGMDWKKAEDNGRVIRDEMTYKNQYFQMTINDSGWVSSIVDKKTGKELLAAPSGVLKVWHDYPNKWEAWNIDPNYRNTVPEIAVLNEQKVVFESDLLIELRQQFTAGSSAIIRTIRLYAHNPRVDMEFSIDWRETRKMLRMETAVNLHYREACFEIQWGAVYRSVHENTTWEQAKFEVPLHRFVSVSEGDLSFAVLNDGKYGAYCKENIIDMNLLRSPIDPDERADNGQHKVIMAFLPLHSSLGEEELFKQAWDLNAPVRILEVDGSSALLEEKKPEEIPAELPSDVPGELLLFDPPFTIKGPGVKIETVKEAESGSDTVLRLYEFLGTSRNVEIQFRSSPQSISSCSLLEEPETLLALGKKLSLSFSPYEIKTLRIQGGL